MTPHERRPCPLTIRMAQDLKIRNMSERTIDSYTYHAAKFADFIKKSLDCVTPEDVRSFQLHLIEERKLAYSSFNQAVCALRFLYTHTIRVPWPVTMVPLPETSQDATCRARSTRSRRSTAMHQVSQTPNLSDYSLCHRHEILRSSQPTPGGHRLQADADSHHPRQGSQTETSSTLAKIIDRAQGILETVQANLAALSRQDTRQALLRHFDSQSHEGCGQAGQHPEEHFASHSASQLCDGTARSRSGSADDQSLTRARQLCNHDDLPALSQRASAQCAQSAGTQYQANCHRLLGLDVVQNADDVVQCETTLSSTGKDTVDATDDESRLQCSVCEGHSLRFVAQTPKPSWSSVLTHTDERCPEWYAETEYGEFCTYLEREYGISYEDWDLGTRIESTMSSPRPAPQPRQLYLPGLSPECAYLIESY